MPADRPVRTVAVHYRALAAGLFPVGFPLASVTDGVADLELLWGAFGGGASERCAMVVARRDGERQALLDYALYVRLALTLPCVRAATAFASRGQFRALANRGLARSGRARSEQRR